MLNERLAGFDFDLTPASARPFVAVPDVAIHVNQERLCETATSPVSAPRGHGNKEET